MQPADVNLFKLLKANWRNTIRQWQNKPENINCVLTKKHFASLLEETICPLSETENFQWIPSLWIVFTESRSNRLFKMCSKHD